jgi:hypothetical protein
MMANGVILGEFAVNPGCVTSINELTRMLRVFGFSHGAVVSEFPAKWVAEVKGKATLLEEPARTAFMEKVNRLRDKALVRLSREASGATWLDRARASNCVRPFHGILHKEKGAGFDSFDEVMNDDEFPPGLREGKAVRNPDAMVNAILPLVQCSERFSLIDPYFGPDEHFLKFVKKLVERNREIKNRALYLDIHLEHDRESKGEVGTFEIRRFKDWVAELPERLVVKVRWWDDERTGELHPRYLITERGGVRFDRGFITPQEYAQRENDADLSMMTEAFIKEVEHRYSEAYEPLRRLHCETYHT